MKNRTSLLLLSMVLVVTACHRRIAPPLERPTPVDLDTSLHEGPYAWDWFACTGSVHIGSSLFSGEGQYNLRMRKDSVVWGVVRFMGIEVVRVRADRDSLVVLNRFDRTVDAYDWPSVVGQTGFPASLPALQRAVLGWLPVVPDSLVLRNLSPDSIAVLGHTGNLELEALLTGPDLLPRQCVYTDHPRAVAAAGWQDEGMVSPRGRVPAERRWEMRSDGGTGLLLQIHVDDPSFSGPLSFPFEIPDRYTRHH